MTASSNIASALTEMAHRQPETVSIIVPDGRMLTYRQLDDDSDLIARGLHAIGIGRGAHVALMVTPSLDFFALMFALFKAGTVPVLIDPGIGLSSLKECLAEAEPEAFIGIPRAQVARLLFGWARGSIKKVVTVGTSLWGGYTLDGVRKAGRNAPAVIVETKADDLAAILFTSGSTGLPKGAVYRHRNFAAQVEMIRDAYGIEPGEINLPTFAPFALFDPALGMTTIVPDMDFSRPGTVNPNHLIDLMEQHGVTNMFGSPAVLARLSELGRPLPKTLRRVLSAGAPMRPVILEGMRKILPAGVQVNTPYGATESLPVATIGSEEILSDTRYGTDEGKGICVGKPNEGVTVSIIAITDEPIASWADVRELPPGEVGEIVARSPTVTTEYFRRDKATTLAKIKLPDGAVAHRMGDVGYFDERGRLWYCGRKSHRVVTPQGTLFTEQVEGAFKGFGNGRSALVGVKRNGATEAVICLEAADVKPRLAENWEQESIRAAGTKFSPAAQVKHVLIYFGHFPVDIRHNAKINREKLAVWAAEQLK